MRGESDIVIRNSIGDGKGEFVPKVGYPNPEGLGLEFL
jgi:hypothetical protein